MPKICKLEYVENLKIGVYRKFENGNDENLNISNIQKGECRKFKNWNMPKIRELTYARNLKIGMCQKFENWKMPEIWKWEDR